MSTGIVSIGLALDHQPTLSKILLGLAGATWVALALVVGLRALRDSTRLRADAGSPAALTGVAATAVLGTRLSELGWTWAAAGSLALAICLWLGLIGPVLRRLARPFAGVALMAVVSTESLSVLAAVLARDESARWLIDVAVVAFVLGLFLYIFVMSRFDFAQLVGGLGDHWITGGALAIATLAITRIALATHTLHVAVGTLPTLKVLSLTLWSISALWLVALVAFEVLRPRLSYDVRRWATVFPIGMYAVSSFDVGALVGSPPLVDFARIWVWLAFAAWAGVLVGMVVEARGREARI